MVSSPDKRIWCLGLGNCELCEKLSYYAFKNFFGGKANGIFDRLDVVLEENGEIKSSHSVLSQLLP